MPTPSVPFPDFRQAATILRALILVKCVQITALYAVSGSAVDFFFALGASAAVFEPSFFLSLLILYVCGPWLGRIGYGRATGCTIAIAMLATLAVETFMDPLLGRDGAWQWIRSPVVAGVLTGLVLLYFNWRARTTSPAMLEARLQSLQARIRPHFLFNSINTVASFIRHDPKLAEKVLLDLSELFRAVLSEERMTVPLRDEMAFARAYVDIEQLRLGERLHAEWHINDATPMDRPVPVLVLQPLIENAVYHGIEPAADGGRVWISLGRSRGALTIAVENTVCEQAPVRRGSQTALANITERLNLLYDGQAEVRVARDGARFSVRIVLPDTLGVA